MERAMEKKIEETVLDILRTSDMQEMTEYKVRKLASERLHIDLSSDPSRKKFVRNVVEAFLQDQANLDAVAAADPDQINDDNSIKVDEDEVVEHEEEEDGDKGSGGREYDDEGDLIICRLSEKRRVTIQDFKGRTLVSIREYYKKDGKYLPTSKGISLTAEQWSSFQKNVPAIEKAIQRMESRLG